MKKLMLSGGAMAIALGLFMTGGAEADPDIVLAVGPLHSKTCVSTVETALKGKGSKVTVTQEKGFVTVTVPHANAVNCLDLVNALRGKGYEPLSVVLRLSADAKVT